MEFFNWKTDYQFCKAQMAKGAELSYEEFVPVRLKQLQQYRLPPIRLHAEDTWAKSGNPYYNVHPQLTSKLCRVDLDKIPSTMFKMPHGLQAVHIRFAQQHPEFTFNEEFKRDRYCIPAGSFLHGALMLKLDKKSDEEDDAGGIMFLTDFGIFEEYMGLNLAVYTIFSTSLRHNMSLGECLQKTQAFGFNGDAKDIGGPYYKIVSNFVRLAVTIGFLSDNPTICEADVLSKDRHKFNEADEKQRSVIADRAKRRGKFGFNVGTDLMFIGEKPKGERRTTAQTGRELEYAHIRGGHPHAVRYGEAKKLVKIMWYVPVTVRDDLPFKKDDD